jgi:type II secretory pathway component PulF
MANFSYQAVNNSTGKAVTGVIEADSLEAAGQAMASNGLLPLKLQEVWVERRSSKRGGLLERLTGVQPYELVLFTKQFKAMYRAGIPILRIIKVLEAQTANLALKRAVGEMMGDIRKGLSLHDAMRKHPSIFSSLYCSMVNAGEVSGTLPVVLDRLCYILEHEHKVKSDIRSALQYPMIVLITLVIAFFVLLTFVMPKFAGIFIAAKLTLPMPTRVTIELHHLLMNYWHIMAIGVFGLVYGLNVFFKTEQGKVVRDSFLLKIPILGPLFIKAAMSRFASIFAILQSSGVPIMTTMSILSGTIGNAAISGTFDSLRSQMEAGRGISGPLSQEKYFPPMVIDMIAIGEETGNIESMLNEISTHYDEEVKHAVGRMADALGPVLVVALAAVVGFFALAIFMPMWDLTKMAK